jgi:mono/diheme cytochrome c family protein
VFTSEQASRGEQIYASKCSACHGDDLLGMETATPLAGPNFRAVWDGQPLLTLGNRIKTTMPPFAPNSLASNEITDLLSFMLKANDHPAGNLALSLPISDSTAEETASIPEDAGEWTTYGADLASTR